MAQHFGPQELEQEDTETRKGVILRYQGRRLTLMVSPAPGSGPVRGQAAAHQGLPNGREFAGRNVIVVGGVSAIQLLDEVSRVTTTTWLTRRPPEFQRGDPLPRTAVVPLWRWSKTGCAAGCRPDPWFR